MKLRVIITLLATLSLGFLAPLSAQTSYNVFILGTPPGGVGAACTAQTYGYLTPTTGGARMVICSPSTHLWAALGTGGGGTGCNTVGSAGQILVDDGAGGCTSATPTISSSTITASLTGHASLDLPLAGGTLTGNLLFTDATLDIGASGATRPRNIFLSGNGTIGGTLSVVGGFSSGTSPPPVTAGTGGVWACAEGTNPSVGAASAVDVISCNSTQHGFLASFNNGSFLPLVQGPASWTTGRVVSTNGTNGGLVADAGFLAANIVQAVSPGAGICHFAGSTQVCTSSLVVSADLNITTSTCSAPQVLTAISATGVGTCATVPVPAGSHSAAYTTVLGDAGLFLLHPTADNNARTFTIDSNANVAYAVGTVITFVNQINTLTIAITSDTLTLAGTASTGSRTCAAGCVATAIKVTSTIWFISGPGLT